MKTIKNLLILIIAITFINCSDDNTALTYTLSYENIAGTYDIQSLSVNTKTTTEIGGFPVTVNANGVGNTFQVDLVMNQDRTYSIKGEHVFVVTVSGPGIPPTTDTEIILIDEAGTYTIDDTNNTVTFVDQNADFLDGVLNVTVFNENTFTLTQEVEETEPLTQTTITANLSVSFSRK